MQDFVWKLPGLRHLSPMWRGGLLAILAVSVSFGALLLISNRVDPSPSFGALLAQIGAALLIAYCVQMSWVVRVTVARNAFYERWIGFVTGLGVLGLSGIAAAVVLADRDAADSVARDALLCWSMASIAILGGLVAFSPALIYDWRRQLFSELDDD